MSQELPDVQAGFRKGRSKRSNCQRPLDHIKSSGIPEKASFPASLTTLKPLTVWITTSSEKFLKRWEYQTA